MMELQQMQILSGPKQLRWNCLRHLLHSFGSFIFLWHLSHMCDDDILLAKTFLNSWMYEDEINSSIFDNPSLSTLFGSHFCFLNTSICFSSIQVFCARHSLAHSKPNKSVKIILAFSSFDNDDSRGTKIEYNVSK